jgi:hypothetical protein
MRTLRFTDKAQNEILHIETQGCIVNIHTKLTDKHGRPTIRVEVIADRDKFDTEGWWGVLGDTDEAGSVILLKQGPKAEVIAENQPEAES